MIAVQPVAREAAAFPEASAATSGTSCRCAWFLHLCFQALPKQTGYAIVVAYCGDNNVDDHPATRSVIAQDIAAAGVFEALREPCSSVCKTYGCQGFAGAAYKLDVINRKLLLAARHNGPAQGCLSIAEQENYLGRYQ